MQGDWNKRHSLISAVREGSLEKVKELISSFGPSYSPDWLVFLCIAVKKNHTEVAKLLLANCSNVNSINGNLCLTPLHFAVRNNAIEIIEMLLDKGANIDAECQKGTTPLHDAVEWDKMDIVGLLLNKGANVNAKGNYDNTDGETALHIASQKSNREVVEVLLKFGASVNSKNKIGRTALHLASDYSNPEIVGVLLEFHADIDSKDKDGKTALHLASQKRKREVIKILLKFGASVNSKDEQGTTALLIASEHNDVETFEVLLKFGADIHSKDIFGHTALYNACFNINSVIKNRFELFGCFDSEYEHCSNIEMVKALLKFGADVHSKSKNGNTALHAASQYNREAVEVLLQFGASVNSKNEVGRTALHIASARREIEMVKVLLKFGANIDSKDKDGSTALHIASQEGYLEVAKVLLEFGANINSKDKDGRTALHVVSQHSDPEIVEVLLGYGADIDSEDKHGRTAFHIACTKTYDEDEWNFLESCDEILKRHAVKVKSANLYMKNRNLLISSDNKELSDLRNECEKEVAYMKTEKIGNISFYDILTKGISELAIYAGNESIRQIFELDDYKKKFPVYATLINSKFRNGERRKNLMEQGSQIFHSFFCNYLGIPYECTENIFNYLSDEDLKNIMDACKPISVSSPNTDDK